MEKIKINIFHTGKVLFSKYLPFGGDNTNLLKASGIYSDKEKQLISLKQVKEQSKEDNCIQVIANHDIDIKPGVIKF